MRRSAQESAGEQRRARRAPPIEIHLPLEPQASAPSCARRRHRRRRRPTAQRCGQSLASAPSLSAHLPPTTAWEMCRRCRCPRQSRCGRRCRRRRSPSRGRAPRPLRVGAPCSSSCADKTFTAPVGVLLDVLVHSGAKTFMSTQGTHTQVEVVDLARRCALDCGPCSFLALNPVLERLAHWEAQNTPKQRPSAIKRGGS